MKTKLSSGLAMAGLAIVLVTGLRAQDGGDVADNRSGKRWQHLAFPLDATKGLGDAEFSRKVNQLGESGWELVDVESVLKDGNTIQRIYFFKRLR